jgi:hypothetical protein
VARPCAAQRWEGKRNGLRCVLAATSSAGVRAGVSIAGFRGVFGLRGLGFQWEGPRPGDRRGEGTKKRL